MLSYVSSYKLFIALTFSYIFSPFEYYHKFFVVNSSLIWLLHLLSLRMLSEFLHFKFSIVLIISSFLSLRKADNDSSTFDFYNVLMGQFYTNAMITFNLYTSLFCFPSVMMIKSILLQGYKKQSQENFFHNTSMNLHLFSRCIFIYPFQILIIYT